MAILSLPSFLGSVMWKYCGLLASVLYLWLGMVLAGSSPWTSTVILLSSGFSRFLRGILLDGDISSALSSSSDSYEFVLSSWFASGRKNMIFDLSIILLCCFVILANFSHGLDTLGASVTWLLECGVGWILWMKLLFAFSLAAEWR